MSKSEQSKKNKAEAKPSFNFVFDRKSYMIMIAGLLVIVLGFALMYGKDDIENDNNALSLATVVVLSGFVIQIFAILRKPKD